MLNPATPFKPAMTESGEPARSTAPIAESEMSASRRTATGAGMRALNFTVWTILAAIVIVGAAKSMLMDH